MNETNTTPQPRPILWYLSERNLRPRMVTEADCKGSFVISLEHYGNLFSSLAEAKRASAAVSAQLISLKNSDMTEFDCHLIERARILSRRDYTLIDALMAIADTDNARERLDDIRLQLLDSYLETAD